MKFKNNKPPMKALDNSSSIVNINSPYSKNY